jgi:hypothetical protein
LGNGSWGNFEDDELAGGFFHGFMRNHLPLFQLPDGKPADFSDDALLGALVRADMLKQFGGGEQRRKSVDDLAPHLLALLRPSRVDKSGKPVPQAGVAFEGGLMVRFLRNEKRETHE